MEEKQKFSDRFLIIPLQETNGKLKISIYDPSQREVLEDVSRVSGRELEIVISPKTVDIMKIILEFHGFRGSIKAAAEKHVKYFKELSDLERLAEVKSLEEISRTDKKHPDRRGRHVSAIPVTQGQRHSHRAEANQDPDPDAYRWSIA